MFECHYKLNILLTSVLSVIVVGIAVRPSNCLHKFAIVNVMQVKRGLINDKYQMRLSGFRLNAPLRKFEYALSAHLLRF